MKNLIAACLITACSLPAAAQVSLDELNAAVDARVSALSTFQDALTDPDPRRALAALQIMIEQGDADQRRMAIRAGLYSTDLAIRSTVLRAILNGKPKLIVNIAPVGDKVNQYYPRSVAGLYGTLKPDQTATILLSIGAYDSEKDCWSVGNNACRVALTADTVSLFIDTWGQLTLDTEGNLGGPATFSQTPVMLTISLVE